MVGIEQNIIKGRIRIYDRDKSGFVLQLYLETDEFEKYLIDKSPLTDELSDFVDKDVIVNCKKYLVSGFPFAHIIVQSYQVV